MTCEKGVQGVFDIGVSGMGPALSPLGKSIVDAKVEKRGKLLAELRDRGLDVDVLTCGRHACSSRCAERSDGDSKEGLQEGSEEDFELIRKLVRLQQARIEHLEYQAALQENKIALLRAALENARGGQ